VRSYRSLSARLPPTIADSLDAGAAEGKPERWQIKTIDTGRFINFKYRASPAF
jgi:hypothetical protein